MTDPTLIYAAGLATAPLLYGLTRLVAASARAVDMAVDAGEETTDAATEE